MPQKFTIRKLPADTDRVAVTVHGLKKSPHGKGHKANACGHRLLTAVLEVGDLEADTGTTKKCEVKVKHGDLSAEFIVRVVSFGNGSAKTCHQAKRFTKRPM